MSASPINFICLLIVTCFHQATSQPKSYSKEKAILIPQVFAEGSISSGDYDTHPALSPDGNTLYFLKCSPDINNTCTICVSFFRSGEWSEPIIAPFSGKYWDVDPFVTADGKTLYFSSNRPTQENGNPKTETDIWKISITPSGWDEPIHLEYPINSEADEYYPTLADNGNLYFGSSRKSGIGGSDIYRSVYRDGEFQQPENLGKSVNTIDNEYEPFISADESVLIFMATIPKGLSNADLYVSYNVKGKWSTPEKLPDPINSSATEWSPKISPDGKYFFFSSTRSIPLVLKAPKKLAELRDQINRTGNGLGDIYQVDLSALKLQGNSK